MKQIVVSFRYNNFSYCDDHFIDEDGQDGAVLARDNNDANAMAILELEEET